MEPAVTREAMVALDRWAIQDVGIPGIVLMENAGRATAGGGPRAWRARPVRTARGRGDVARAVPPGSAGHRRARPARQGNRLLLKDTRGDTAF